MCHQLCVWSSTCRQTFDRSVGMDLSAELPSKGHVRIISTVWYLTVGFNIGIRLYVLVVPGTISLWEVMLRGVPVHLLRK